MIMKERLTQIRISLPLEVAETLHKLVSNSCAQDRFNKQMTLVKDRLEKVIDRHRKPILNK